MSTLFAQYSRGVDGQKQNTFNAYWRSTSSRSIGWVASGLTQDLEHTSTAYRAGSLKGLATIFHDNLIGTFDLLFGLTLYAISYL